LLEGVINPLQGVINLLQALKSLKISRRTLKRLKKISLIRDPAALVARKNPLNQNLLVGSPLKIQKTIPVL